MDYKVLDMEKYYRKDIYRHFTMDCKCSVMITSKICLLYTSPSPRDTR